MPTLSTKSHSSLMFVLTTHTKSTVLSAVDVQRQTERMWAITMRLKCEITYSKQRQQSTNSDHTICMHFKVKFGTFAIWGTQALYDLESGSWLARANDTAAHYTVIYCHTIGRLDHIRARSTHTRPSSCNYSLPILLTVEAELAWTQHWLATCARLTTTNSSTSKKLITVIIISVAAIN